MDELDEQTAQEAKNKLEQAIMEYYSTVSPEAFINGWVLVTHKVILSTDENFSAIGYLVPTGQYWTHTLGYLTAASDTARNISN